MNAENFNENVRSALMHFVFIGKAENNRWGWWAGDSDKVSARYMDLSRNMGPTDVDFMGVHAEQHDALNAGINYLLKCRPDIVKMAKREANEGQRYRARSANWRHA